MPNYENPTMEEYLSLLDCESFTVQMAECFDRLGYVQARNEALEDKKRLRIARICMKAALKMKKAPTAVTVSAVANSH